MRSTKCVENSELTAHGVYLVGSVAWGGETNIIKETLERERLVDEKILIAEARGRALQG